MHLELFYSLVRQSAVALREKPARARWTEDVVSELTAMWDDNVPIEWIAELLGRTESSIASKAFRWSWSVGNRVCHHCKNSDEFNGRPAA